MSWLAIYDKDVAAREILQIFKERGDDSRAISAMVESTQGGRCAVFGDMISGASRYYFLPPSSQIHRKRGISTLRGVLRVGNWGIGGIYVGPRRRYAHRYRRPDGRR